MAYLIDRTMHLGAMSENDFATFCDEARDEHQVQIERTSRGYIGRIVEGDGYEVFTFTCTAMEA